MTEKHFSRKIKTIWINILNSLGYLYNSKVLIKAGFKNAIWGNWSREYYCIPKKYFVPETEQEICDIVRNAKKVRVVGGGHSFNASPLCDDVLISLDKYNKILDINKEDRIVKVAAGIRLVDLEKILQLHGLALPVLGSTDHQSLAGVVATDVHGTGKDHGFLSEQILELRIVDANGNAHTYNSQSDIFHASIGGLGLCGIIIEVELQCVQSYNLEKSVQVFDIDWWEQNYEKLLAENDHLSIYYLGGTALKQVRVNIWNHTLAPVSANSAFWKKILEFSDIMGAGCFVGIATIFRLEHFVGKFLLFIVKHIFSQKNHIYTWNEGFARTLFFRHDEIEMGIPFENFRACINDVRNLLLEERFVTFIEVRFTPSKSEALIGPGVGRRTCYIELATSSGQDTTHVYQLFEKLLLKHGGQPHMGKKMWLNSEDFKTIYGKRLEHFMSARLKQDPNGKFVNKFISTFF
jgi:hypothetical protein